MLKGAISLHQIFYSTLYKSAMKKDANTHANMK
jgi:hypothetical protein